MIANVISVYGIWKKGRNTFYKPPPKRRVDRRFVVIERVGENAFGNELNVETHTQFLPAATAFCVGVRIEPQAEDRKITALLR